MLTEELALSKSKAKSLDEVKNLSLWGSDLENIDIIAKMSNIEIVSLSVNKISNLKPFENLQNLRELYLRKNNISDLNQIKHLRNCKNLKVLWLAENPVCNNKEYRNNVIEVLPQIVVLDNIHVSSKEDVSERCSSPKPLAPTNLENSIEDLSMTKLNNRVDRILKTSQSSKRPGDTTLVNDILKNYDNSIGTDTSENIKQIRSPRKDEHFIKGEEYINKLDNIDDIKNFFNSTYCKKEKQQKSLKGNINRGNSGNKNYKPPMDNYNNYPHENNNMYHQVPINQNIEVSDNQGMISRKNAHVVSAILNLMEDLSLRELIHVRNQILKTQKRRNGY